MRSRSHRERLTLNRDAPPLTNHVPLRARTVTTVKCEVLLRACEVTALKRHASRRADHAPSHARQQTPRAGSARVRTRRRVIGKCPSSAGNDEHTVAAGTSAVTERGHDLTAKE